jgi:hypothetical protein
MRRRFFLTTALVAVTALAVFAASVPAGAAPTAESAALRQFEGTVVSKNNAARTFRLRDTERGTVRIRVTRNTRFERIDGFAGLKVGATNIESTVRRRDGRWIAIEVERSGGGGQHGGDDSRGGDDNPSGDDD